METQRPRVLVLPSWYPTTSTAAGAFFQEQAAHLQQRYDMRVLFGISRPIGYRQALRRLRWPPLRGRAWYRETAPATLREPPAAVGFEYVHRSPTDEDHFAAATRCYRKMLKKLMATGWKPDLLHAECAEMAGIITARLAKEFHLPWVLTEHQVFVLSRYSEWRRRKMLEAIAAASELVAVSHHQLRCMFMHGVDRAASIVGNLIDEQMFAFVPPGRDYSKFRILTVTYPMPIKDCGTFFHAVAATVGQGHSDIEVTVIGNDAFEDASRANTDAYENLAANYGVRQVCRFVPHVPRHEMPKLYANCDVFVSASISETFGIAVREAMAVGRPVVCTASGGVDEILSPSNGVKVNIRDHEALAEALIAIKTGRLVFEPQRIRDSVVSRHGRSAFLEQMSAVYERAIANGCGALPAGQVPAHEAAQQ